MREGDGYRINGTKTWITNARYGNCLARCALTLALREFDLVVNGEAHLVTDPGTVAELARLWAVDWPCAVDESGTALTAPFSAPSAGRPP